jgi:hypothetical protein
MPSSIRGYHGGWIRIRAEDFRQILEKILWLVTHLGKIDVSLLRGIDLSSLHGVLVHIEKFQVTRGESDISRQSGAIESPSLDWLPGALCSGQSSWPRQPSAAADRCGAFAGSSQDVIDAYRDRSVSMVLGAILAAARAMGFLVVTDLP